MTLKNMSREILYLSGVAILFLFLGIIFEINYYHDNYSGKDIRKFEKTLHKKETFLKNEFDRLVNQFKDSSPLEVLQENSEKYQKISAEEGIFLFYYENDSLRYWSDHTVPIRDLWRLRYEAPFQVYRNADYAGVHLKTQKGILLGFIGIRTHYSIKNNFLESKYFSDFKLNPDVQIDILESEETLPVYNLEGQYLFSFDFSEVVIRKARTKVISLISYFLFFLLLILIIFIRIIHYKGNRRVFIPVLITLLLFAGSYLMVKLKIPAILFETALFQPDIFASRYFDSLGHLLIFAIVAFIIAVILNRNILLLPSESRLFKNLAAAVLFTVSAIWFIVICRLVEILVLDSNISFESYRLTSITVYTFLGFFIVALFFAVLAIILDSGMRIIGRITFRQSLFIVVMLAISVLVFAFLSSEYINLFDFMFFMAIVASQVYLRTRSKKRILFSGVVLLLLIVSVFTTFKFRKLTDTNILNQKEIELVKLSSEHDPVAEMLFSQTSQTIRNDSILGRFILSPYINIDYIFNRLRRNYFSGYWNKYDIQITICTPEDRVYLQPPDDEWLHCYSFFDTIIKKEGIQIEGSDFYFLDNLNGRISYLASIPFYHNDFEKRLFLELDSKIISEEMGYPELLLDEDYVSFTNSRFSYAKYNRGQLITQSGDFPYRRSSEFYTGGKESFENIIEKGYNHMIYNVDGQNTIIVGTPVVTFMDNLISFSYIFAFYFLLLAILYLIISARELRIHFKWNFKNKIQYSMVGILFLTFVFICSGTVFFMVKQYRDKHYDNLRNTMRSIYIELIHKVEYEEDLRNWSSEGYYNLDELLRKFSNVFYSDINLYDESGYIMATSRSEVFDQQLLSTRMNRLVYEKLIQEGASEYILTERIGKLSYLSAYVPLLNRENRLLAYLNLPYFTQAEVLTQDITNLVVAVLNIYVILFLVILTVSVVLADRITQPLRMIQSRIARVSLSKENEKIVYNRSDEIRGLVEEYNYMVDEIERSALLLAQSERESAWREMAKQIAHEIKNPLTPMKLNVQHLQRTFKGKGSDREMIDKISRTLIEQIDSLSSIAREFSDFAKMPKAKNERINLVSKLKNTLELFEATDRIKVTMDLGGFTHLYVFADKEQLMRVFINLIKNSIQSIPENEPGKIEIRLHREDEHHALVSIKDNGKGIPDEIKDRLFHPNFTTKSGGMGMGLAIASNIIKSFNGAIWYETELNKGTNFFVRIPLDENKAEPVP
ncbi:MAG: GHKL domain-containing protein [Bacteroidales bacterium]|nr:GHKL domain-containing protein [Bacteroidales bacterium]